VRSQTRKAHRFLAAIYKIGINRAVNVPEKISREQGGAAYVPVIAMVGSRIARTTLMPEGGCCYRLYLDTRLRKAAGVDTGDIVGVMLEVDRESRELPVPPELHAALCPFAESISGNNTGASPRISSLGPRREDGGNPPGPNSARFADFA